MRTSVVIGLTVCIVALLVGAREIPEYKIPLLIFAVILILVEVGYIMKHRLDNLSLYEEDDDGLQHEIDYEEIVDYVQNNSMVAFESISIKVEEDMIKYYQLDEPRLDDPAMEGINMYQPGYIEATAWQLYRIDWHHRFKNTSIVESYLKQLDQLGLILAKEILSSRITFVGIEFQRRIVAGSVEYFDLIQNSTRAEETILRMASMFINVETNNYRYLQLQSFVYARNRYYDQKTAAAKAKSPMIDGIVSDVVNQLVSGCTPPSLIQEQALPMIQQAYEDTVNTKPMHARDFRALQTKILNAGDEFYKPLTAWLLTYLEAIGKLPEIPVRVLDEDGDVGSVSFYDAEVEVNDMKEYVLQCRVRLGIRQRKLTEENIDSLCGELEPDAVRMFRKGMLNEYIIMSFSTYKPVTLTVAMSKLLINELRQIKDVRTVSQKRSRKTKALQVV